MENWAVRRSDCKWIWDATIVSRAQKMYLLQEHHLLKLTNFSILSIHLFFAQVLELSSRFLVVDNLGTKNLQRNLKGFSLDKSTQLRLFEKLEINQILILKLANHVLLDFMWVDPPSKYWTAQSPICCCFCCCRRVVCRLSKFQSLWLICFHVFQYRSTDSDDLRLPSTDFTSS